MTARLEPGIYTHKHDKQTYIVTGEFEHSEDGLLYVACVQLKPPFLPRLLTKPTFEELGCPFEPHEPHQESPVTPGIWQHFIAGQFFVHGEYYRPPFGEAFVAYRALQSPYRALVRQKTAFLEHLDRPDIPYVGPRFRLIHAS